MGVHVQALPDRPSLDHLRQQAKDLRRALPDPHRLSLTAAQTLVARRYGFRSWPELKAEVERRREQLVQEARVAMKRDDEVGGTREDGERVPVRLRPGRALAVVDGAGDRVGALSTMVRKSLSTQPVLRVRRQVAGEDFHPGADLSTVERVMLSEGLLQAGPPYGQFEQPDAAGPHTVEFGIPTSDLGRGEGEVEAAEQPGGVAATAFYYGPFSGLRDAHRLLGEQIAAAGLTAAGSMREMYHTAPEETDPDHHVTELIWPLTL